MHTFNPLLSALIVLLMAGGPTAALAQSDGADATADSMAAAFVDAWNAHDATRLGDQFTDDGDFVGLSGQWWKGPDEIASVHSDLFAGRYDQSVFVVDEEPTAALIRPGVVLVHWPWTISQVRDSEGEELEPYSGIFTWLLVERDGEWGIRAAHNNVTDE